jgi:triosephosphate isomerase
MKAIEITSYGAPQVLQVGARPEPVAGAGELLIRVAASGVNRPDVLQRTGNYPVPPGASDLPGLEVAGVVVSGDAAAMAQAGLAVGDHACALVAGGGYAEFCVAPVGQCLPVPKGLSDTEAATLPETFFTVWSNVFDRARLQKGETLLVQGGSSGIGVTAIQMAKALGATVIVTAGSDDKCAACLALGADHAINYKSADFVAEAKRPGRRRPAGHHRRAGRHQERIQCRHVAAPAAHRDRLDPAAPASGLQGGHRPVAEARGMAADRKRQDQAGGAQRVSRRWWRRPAQRRRAGPCADGIEPARGQNRFDLVNPMTKKLIAGNWKMNGGLAFNQTLVQALRAGLSHPDCDVAVCVPAPYLAQLQGLLAGGPIELGAQDISEHDAGAYTGEVSAAMLKDFGVRYAIVGHSERRQYHGESDAVVAAKTARALASGITPIVCVGETLAEREAGKTEETVKRQLAAVIHVNGHCISEIVVAYEPVWAIGTGKTATPDEAQQVHAVLRAQLHAATDRSAQMRILYGGSMNAANAAQLLAQPDIDGGLIGGAALKAPDFLTIVAAAG